MDTFGNDLNSGGQVLSRKELIQKRQRNGQCASCGQRCFKKKLFKLEPLTVTGKVLAGRCLLCNPQDPKTEVLVAFSAPTARAPSTNSIQPRKKGAGRARSGGLASSVTNIGSNFGFGQKKGTKAAGLADSRGHSSMRDIQDDESLLDESDYSTNISANNSTNDRKLQIPPTVRRHTTDAATDGEDREEKNGGTTHAATDGKEKNGGTIDRRASMERKDSQRAGSFLTRRTPRPSVLFLDGLNIEDLFDDGNKTNASVQAAASRLTSDERHALHSLNSDTNSFLDIVNIMLVNSMSMTVQNEGLHALSLAHDPDVDLLRECAVSCGFEVIVSAMGICNKDAMAQTNACKVLFIASASGIDLQRAIGGAGACEALLDAMKKFESDVIVMEGCLLALSNLCIPEDNLPSALAAEVIELAVNAMSQAVENCGLQEHGCAVLANLAVHEDARKRIRDCGGCDSVVVSMVVNPMDEGVQCQALLAIRNLCAMDDENKVLLANAGAIDVVIQAMLNHRDDVQIQFRGSWVLGIIGVNEDNKLYIGENGGVDVIVRSMFVHADDLGIQEKGCRALWTLSVNHQNRYSMVEAEAIPAIVVAMQKHADDPEIQQRGCGVLCNLAANDDELKVQIVDEGALDGIVMAMVLHGENEFIQERAVALLYKLCIPENISRMVNANVSPMMAVVAETFPDCQEKAAYVLSQLDGS